MKIARLECDPIGKAIYRLKFNTSGIFYSHSDLQFNSKFHLIERNESNDDELL